MKQKKLIYNLNEIIETINYLSDCDISKVTRRRNYVILRGIYYKIARQFTTYSLDEISKKLNRTHATVLNSLQTIDQDLKRESYSKIYETALEMLELKPIETKEYKTQSDIKIAELGCELEKYNSVNSEILKILSTFTDEQQQEFLEYKLKPHQKLIQSRVKPKVFTKVAGATFTRKQNA